eukprot:scaffold19949_cov120-Isochrysis_galbana.AAC.2
MLGRTRLHRHSPSSGCAVRVRRPARARLLLAEPAAPIATQSPEAGGAHARRRGRVLPASPPPLHPPEPPPSTSYHFHDLPSSATCYIALSVVTKKT